MEVSGVVFRSIPTFSGGAAAHSHSSSSFLSGSRFSGDIRLLSTKFPTGVSGSGFRDNGHIEYYYSKKEACSAIRCGKKDTDKDKGSSPPSSGLATPTTMKQQKKMMMMKKKNMMKLLKGLSKDLTLFSSSSSSSSSDLAFGGLVGSSDDGDVLVGEAPGRMISDAADLLLAQLQKLKAEEKELKRKKKEDKAKLKSARMLNCEAPSSGSSSSSESSDSECGEVVDMSRWKSKSSLVAQPLVMEELHSETRLTLPKNTPAQEANVIELAPVIQEPILPTLSSIMAQEHDIVQTNSSQIPGTRCCETCAVSNISLVEGTEGDTKMIEVCMGGKCKKSGAAMLLEEFQRTVGVEGAVVGCKCMGKCRDGPNVRVLNHLAHTTQAEDSVRTPTNPLCIGVGLQDVGLILSNFFGESQRDLGGLAATTAS